MKKTIIFICIFLSFESFSQITLDFKMPNNLQFVRLSNTKTKFGIIEPDTSNSNNHFSLFNLDGSIYKTIQIPPNSDPSETYWSINYITESLFDNDSSTIEYLLISAKDTGHIGFIYHCKVLREDGTTLLDEMNGCQHTVITTEEGTKLMLNYVNSAGFNIYQTKVFNLPGILPNSAKDEIYTTKNNLSIYPNPNNGSFYIKLQSKNKSFNTIDIYTETGKLIDTFKSTNNPMQIKTSGLPDGLYILNSCSGRMISTAKMILKK